MGAVEAVLPPFLPPLFPLLIHSFVHSFTGSFTRLSIHPPIITSAFIKHLLDRRQAEIWLLGQHQSIRCACCPFKVPVTRTCVAALRGRQFRLKPGLLSKCELFLPHLLFSDCSASATSLGSSALPLPLPSPGLLQASLPFQMASS